MICKRHSFAQVAAETPKEGKGWNIPQILEILAQRRAEVRSKELLEDYCTLTKLKDN